MRIRYKKPDEDKSILLQEPLLVSNPKASIDKLVHKIKTIVSHHTLARDEIKPGLKSV